MPACTSCGRSAGHFDGCPLSVTDELVTGTDGTLTLRRTANTDPPICGPKRLGDRLDRYAQTLAEREREG